MPNVMSYVFVGLIGGNTPAPFLWHDCGFALLAFIIIYGDRIVLWYFPEKSGFLKGFLWITLEIVSIIGNVALLNSNPKLTWIRPVLGLSVLAVTRILIWLGTKMFDFDS